MHVYRITLYIHSQMEPSSFTSLTAPTPAPTDLHRLSWGSWISELVITLLLVLFAIINSHPRRGLGESDLNETALMKRALGLLSLWGECVYFESPPELSDIVILDPRFLAKGILADLFSSNPTVQSMKRNGVMRHADLQHIWKGLE